MYRDTSKGTCTVLGRPAIAPSFLPPIRGHRWKTSAATCTLTSSNLPPCYEMGSFQYRKQQLHPTSHQRTPLVALQAIDLGATQPPPSTAAATTYVSPSDTQIATRRQATLYDGLTDNDQNSVQNGGIQGFLKVFGCFCVFFITLGMASTFGSYQAYYESGPLQSYSPSAISWIGTTQVFLLSFMGLFSGIFYDRGYTRSVLALGMTLIVLGLMTLSLTQAFWQILLTQGICVGFGMLLILKVAPRDPN